MFDLSFPSSGWLTVDPGVEIQACIIGKGVLVTWSITTIGLTSQIFLNLPVGSQCSQVGHFEDEVGPE